MAGKNKITNNQAKITNNQLQHIVFNLGDASLIRNEELEGRKYLAIPSTILVEGVHCGTNGALFYPGEEVTKTPAVWNHKPIVVYHPTINGEGCSACDAEIINSRKVGLMMNARADTVTVVRNKKNITLPAIKLEAWIDPEKAAIVDNRIMEAIAKKQSMELSTGVFTDNESVEGDWNGEKYIAIARNYRPDHLALLPDQKGACSRADGAGFMVRNSADVKNRIPESFAKDFFPFMEAAGIDTSKLILNEVGANALRQLLQGALREKITEGWIEEVYSSYIIYDLKGRLYKLNYTVNKDVAKLSGVPEEVVREIQYKTKTGAVLNSNIKGEWKIIHGIPLFVDGVNTIIGNESDEGTWITVGGRHILIGKGESKGDAVKRVKKESAQWKKNAKTVDKAIAKIKRKGKDYYINGKGKIKAIKMAMTRKDWSNTRPFGSVKNKK